MVANAQTVFVFRPGQFLDVTGKTGFQNGKPVANPPAQIFWQGAQLFQRFVGNEQLKICASHKISSRFVATLFVSADQILPELLAIRAHAVKVFRQFVHRNDQIILKAMSPVVV
jgi:hypothetical protein